MPRPNSGIPPDSTEIHSGVRDTRTRLHCAYANLKCKRKQCKIQKGHGSGIKNTDKEKIEMEDFSRGHRSTENMKYKPHNRCDRENNKSCKHKGKEGPLLNSMHARTCAWMTLSIPRFLFGKHDFATGDGYFCWRNSSLVCSASWEKDYELLQLQTSGLQVTCILREALRSWTFLPLRSLIGFKAYLTVSCVTTEWKILISSSHLGRLWLSLRICGTLLQEFFSPACWTSSFI